jgi:hypothetical protein
LSGEFTFGFGIKPAVRATLDRNLLVFSALPNSALEKTSVRRQDIVVLTIRPLSTGAAEFDLKEDQIFGDHEKHLFTRVVTEAETEGKHVELVVAPAANPFDGMVRVAAQLGCSRLVTGVSARMAPEELSRRIGLAWENLPEPRHPFALALIQANQPPIHVNLGPHPPRLVEACFCSIVIQETELKARVGGALRFITVEIGDPEF